MGCCCYGSRGLETGLLIEAPLTFFCARSSLALDFNDVLLYTPLAEYKVRHHCQSTANFPCSPPNFVEDQLDYDLAIIYACLGKHK